MSNLPRDLVCLAVLLALAAVLIPGAQAQSNPDLAVAEIQTDPDPPEPGEQATVHAVIRNEGDQDSQAFTYNFTIDGEMLGENQTHEEGVPGNEQVTVTAPAGWQVTAGEHTVLVQVDHQDDDLLVPNDNNPDNDRRESAYTIGADVTISDLSVDPENPIEGDTLEFTAEVKNLADEEDAHGDVTSPFQVRFSIAGETLTSTIDELGAGNTTSVSQTWTSTEGQHTLEAVVDPDEQVHDRDRSNNAADSVTVDVAPALPDLVVGDLVHSPQQPAPGDEVTFEVTLRNNGDADAGEHEVALVVDESTVDTATVEGIDQGAEANVTLSWEAVEGRRNVDVIVDPDDGIEEINDDNNAWTTELAVGSDLFIETFDMQPPEPRASDRVRFTVEVGNDGLDVTDAFEVAITVDDSPLDAIEISELAAGETRNVTSVAWNASVGDHNVTVILDPDEAVAEITRSNNQHYADVTVGEPQPDLTVLSAGLEAAVPQEGEETTLKAQVQNAGSQDADGFTVRAAIGEETIGEVTIDELAAGEQVTIDIGNWTPTTGLHRLTVVADADDDVEETSEENNRLVESLGVGPDLEALSLSVDDGDAQPGENVTALLLVKNNGTVQIPETNVTFAIDDEQITTTSLDSLTPNEEASVEITFSARISGTIAATVDASEEIEEFNEDNNRASAQLELQSDAPPPDLTVRGIEAAGDAGDAEPVTFLADVANTGDGPSPQASLTFRLDGEDLGDAVSVPSLAAGENVTVESPEWSSDGGDHELEVIVDEEGNIEESDETNNALTHSIDAQATSIPIGPGVAAAGLLAGALIARREQNNSSRQR